MDTTKALKPGRDLLPEEVFARLVKRIAAEHHLDEAMAERCMDQALAFLAACAVTPKALSPSMAADIGWHMFILYTRDYADFCEQVAGRFIHHIPDEDEGGHEDEADVQAVLDRSAEAIRKAGYRVDRELWQNEGALKCSQCHNGCSDDPPPVPPFHKG